jgi:spore coat polysaccharide biosynthesis protein SpsF (cytidylyltransferase family)
LPSLKTAPCFQNHFASVTIQRQQHSKNKKIIYVSKKSKKNKKEEKKRQQGSRVLVARKQDVVQHFCREHHPVWD